MCGGSSLVPHDVVSTVGSDGHLRARLGSRRELRLVQWHDAHHHAIGAEILVGDAFDVGSRNSLQACVLLLVIAGVAVKDRAIIKNYTLAQVGLELRHEAELEP